MSRQVTVRSIQTIIVACALLLMGLPPAISVSSAAAAPTIALSRNSVGPGDTVVVSGSGFTPTDLVGVYADFRVGSSTKRVASTQTVDQSGNFSAPLKVPAGSNPGTYSVVARDFHGHTATTNLTVLPLLFVKVGSQPSTVSVPAGTGFFVTGSGFLPGEGVRISATFPLYNGNAVIVSRNAGTDANGNFGEVYLLVPNGARTGRVTLTATGAKSGKAATGFITVVYRPTITPASDAVHPGSSLPINGQGFVPGSRVHVSVSGPNGSPVPTASADPVANASGAFTTSVTIPAGSPTGKYTIAAHDTTAGFNASNKFNVSLAAAISVKPASVRPGQSVTVSGSGYSANVTVQLQATFPLYGGGSRTVTLAGYTNSSGSFSVALTVPGHAAAGNVTITAKGPHTSSHAFVQVGRIGASIRALPGQAQPGSVLTVRGTGFPGSDRIDISVTFTLLDGTKKTIGTTTTAGQHGNAAASIQIPANTAGGVYTIQAHSQTSGRTPTTTVTISALRTTLRLNPMSVIPGATATASGTGFLAGTTVNLTVVIKLNNGSSQTLNASAKTGAQGNFTATITVPRAAAPGAYTVTARSAAGRTATGVLTVVKLAPSIVVLPTAAAPGTDVTVNGFGFASGASVSVNLQGQPALTVTANGSGQFSAKISVPAAAASGSYTVIAQSSSGRKASATLLVNRQVSTHFYFASLYTGTKYHEYLDFVNSTATLSHVTITYQLTNGTSRTKSAVVPAHSRFTQDVNADLGPKVSAAAAVSADVAIAVERQVFYGTDGAVVPGVTSPSRTWYFANGNTSKHYRTYLAIQNPNSGPVQVAVNFLPTHHRAFTIYRTVAATSRTTIKVNSFVRKDAVGFIIRSNGPVVVNRTIFIRHGMNSKIGVQNPSLTWYFAAGPHRSSARNWIGIVNTSNARTYVTLRAYGTFGTLLGHAGGFLRAHARVGYLINKIAGQADAAIVITSSRPIVVEQTTYNGRNHQASTDTFGVRAPAKSWQFAAVNTLASQGDTDFLDLFNPNNVAVPVVVNFFSTSGQISTRTYIIGPLYHVRVDVGSVVPNAQLGMVAASNYPFVALNRGLFGFGNGGFTSRGVH